MIARLFQTLLIFGASGAAQAAMSTVGPLGGVGQERCLIGPTCAGAGTAYNGEISIIHALEMDTGATLIRVDDSLDRIWATTLADGGQVLTRARYAADSLELGFDAGAGFQPLVTNVGNSDVLVTNPSLFSGAHASDFVALASGDGDWTAIPASPTAAFAFVLKDLTTGNNWSSNNSGSGVGSSGYANSANRDDHMVTFRAGAGDYFIAWEDRPLSAADKDYNDMVVEVRFVNPVPLPAPVLLLLSALLGLGVLRRAAPRAAAAGA